MNNDEETFRNVWTAWKGSDDIADPRREEYLDAFAEAARVLVGGMEKPQDPLAASVYRHLVANRDATLSRLKELQAEFNPGSPTLYRGVTGQLPLEIRRDILQTGRARIGRAEPRSYSVNPRVAHGHARRGPYDGLVYSQPLDSRWVVYVEETGDGEPDDPERRMLRMESEVVVWEPEDLELVAEDLVHEVVPGEPSYRTMTARKRGEEQRRELEGLAETWRVKGVLVGESE